MKASISARGTLKISAETGLESFALKYWSEVYFHDKPDQPGDPMLLIEITLVEDKREHHIACCFQVTGGLEPCDCPLSTPENKQ